jgi:hypothetical protein
MSDDGPDPFDGDESWIDRVQTAIDLVRAWEKRTTTDPGWVEPQSPLARDDSGGLGLPVSTLAWHGLQSSVDHLAQIADIMAARVIPIRPYAPFTLARAALLAAGQAVWLLTGTTREERIKRAVQVYVDDWENHREYQQDLKDDPFLKKALAPDELAIIDALISELDLRLAAARATNPGRTTQTKMLREAARWVTQGEADGWLRVALGREWRLGSAAAHSRKWSLNVRSGANLGTGEDGGVGSVSTTADEFGTSIIAATLMAREGFRLWDESRLATD